VSPQTSSAKLQKNSRPPERCGERHGVPYLTSKFLGGEHSGGTNTEYAASGKIVPREIVPGMPGATTQANSPGLRYHEYMAVQTPISPLKTRDQSAFPTRAFRTHAFRAHD